MSANPQHLGHRDAAAGDDPKVPAAFIAIIGDCVN